MAKSGNTNKDTNACIKPEERGWRRAYGTLQTLFRAANAASENTQERARGNERVATKLPSALSFPLARSRVLSLTTDEFQEMVGLVTGRTPRTTLGRNEAVMRIYITVAEGTVPCSKGMEDYLEPRFECPICLTWLRDPVLTSCGHKFCSQCIYTWLQKEGARCPVDSRPLKSESDLFRDLYTSREILQQRTPCPYQRFGCEITLSPVDMETHTNQCVYKQSLSDSQNIHCHFKSVGCIEAFCIEEDLHAHLEANINLHLTMVLKTLPQLSVMQSHASTIAVESKMWDPPSKSGTSSDKNEPPPEWQQLLKNLYERIVVLEQQNRELSITVSNQSTQLTTLQTSLRFNQEEMFLRSCNGVYIWRLHTFHEKLAGMINDPLKMFYSPGFYTSPNGYKMCARINVSSKDPEFLSLLLHIMKSENDDGLDWPFNGMMYFILVHPRDSEKDIREITSSRPDLEAFRKPVCELNKRSFGYTEFVRIRNLSDFLQNDCLIFRIEVRVQDRYKMPV